jgi:prepilin-type N-terminal cleavage/methylation domain-containing protein
MGLAPGEGPALKRGFTLLEVLVTVAVLSLGCLAALQMQGYSLRGSTMADNMTAATFLAEAEMERLKSLSRSDLDQEADGGTRVTGDLDRLGEVCPPAPAVCDPGVHSFTRTTRYFPETPTSLSHHVEVGVAWVDNSGGHEVILSAIVTSLTF